MVKGPAMEATRGGGGEILKYEDGGKSMRTILVVL